MLSIQNEISDSADVSPFSHCLSIGIGTTSHIVVHSIFCFPPSSLLRFHSFFGWSLFNYKLLLSKIISCFLFKKGRRCCVNKFIINVCVCKRLFVFRCVFQYLRYDQELVSMFRIACDQRPSELCVSWTLEILPAEMKIEIARMKVQWSRRHV